MFGLISGFQLRSNGEEGVRVDLRIKKVDGKVLVNGIESELTRVPDGILFKVSNIGDFLVKESCCLNHIDISSMFETLAI